MTNDNHVDDDVTDLQAGPGTEAAAAAGLRPRRRHTVTEGLQHVTSLLSACQF